MTQTLATFRSLLSEHANVTGTISAIAEAVYMYRNGVNAGTIALEPADIALLKAYPLNPGTTSHIPLAWFINALSQRLVDTAASQPMI